MNDQTTEVKRKDLRFIYQLITDASEELSSGNIGMVGSRIGYLQHAFLTAFEGKLMDERLNPEMVAPHSKLSAELMDQIKMDPIATGRFAKGGMINPNTHMDAMI